MSEVSNILPRSGREKDYLTLLRFGRIVSLFGLAIIIVMLCLNRYTIAVLVASVLCGMAESRGRCGVSHIGMLAPIKSMDPSTWFKCCFAYAFSGAVTAYLIGLIIASLGTVFSIGTSPIYLGCTCLVCCMFLLRDFGVLRFQPPQCNHQTYKEWAYKFGMVTGAGMWGAHIGLALSTVVTYGGLYCLLLVVFGFGLGFGEWVLVAFWVGRVVFLWSTPFLMDSTSDGRIIGAMFERATSMFRFCSLSGLVGILVISLAMLYTQLT